MIVPIRVFTSGFVRLKNELLLFHSRPSGFRIARSYCSRDVNGNGTPSTRIARSFASAFWLIITCSSCESLRSGIGTSGFATRRRRFGCGASYPSPRFPVSTIPAQLPQPSISTSF